MRAPIMFAAVIPLVMCCRMMLNLRECYEKQSATTTTQGIELSEWCTRIREPRLEPRLDSMGLPRLSSERLVAPDFWLFIGFFIATDSDASSHFSMH